MFWISRMLGHPGCLAGTPSCYVCTACMYGRCANSDGVYLRFFNTMYPNVNDGVIMRPDIRAGKVRPACMPRCGGGLLIMTNMRWPHSMESIQSHCCE